MIIHYNFTIGSILSDSFLLIYHSYPPSFHVLVYIEMKGVGMEKWQIIMFLPVPIYLCCTSFSEKGI